MLENIDLKNDRQNIHELNGKQPASQASPTQIARIQKKFEIICYRSLSSARSQEQFSAKISHIIEQMGFSGFSFTYLTLIPSLLFTDLPKDLVLACKKGGYIKDDYAISYGLSSSQPILRSTIENYMVEAPVETHDMARNRILSDFYKNHGLHDFYLIPIISGDRRFLFSITSRTDDIYEFYDTVANCEQELMLLGKMILQLGKSKFKDLFEEAKTPHSIKTTAKPRLMLERLAKEDMTLTQLSDVIGISIHTADKHSMVIRKALGARTIAGAVYIALREGIIDFN